jgi:hypothetical protein
MAIHWVQNDAAMVQFLQVATAQYVEQWDAVALQADTVVRATDIAWAAAVATPSAPTVANAAVNVGSPLTNALTNVKISYQFPWGEGALSAAGNATPTAGAFLLVSGTPLTPPTPALYTNVYVETSAGSGVYKLFDINYTGASMLIGAYGIGQSPTASPVLSGALQITQFNFAQIFAGISSQRKCSPTGPNQALFGNNAYVFGNSAANQVMVVRRGIFQCDLASATTLQPGTNWVGMAKDTGNDLLNQQVVLVSNPALAIGVVAVDSNYGGVLQATNYVLVEINSTLNAQQASQYNSSMSGAAAPSGLMV